ncbi:MAG: glycerophosphoryl diester phosphodiesterase membrane domain-containing protein, partial [Actinomycetota bacterium]
PVGLYALSEGGWEEAWSAFRTLEPTDAWTDAGESGLQPMLAGEIIGRSFRVWGRNFWTLAGIAAVLLIPSSTLLLLLNLSTLRTVQRTVQGSRVGVPEVPSWVSIVGNITTTLVMALLTGAVVVAVGWFLLGRRPRIGASYAFAFRKWLSLVWVVILEFFAILAPLVPGLAILLSAPVTGEFRLAGVLLTLIGGVVAAFLFVRLLFAPVSVVVEGRRGTRALERSWRLTRGFGWRIVGVFLLIALIVGGAFLLAFVLLSPILVQGGLTEATFRAFFIAAFVLGAILGVVSNPLFHVATVLLYLDARVRKEAFTLPDLEGALPERG